jgi:glycosyltransferase involved in cell wall biosynthesis
MTILYVVTSADQGGAQKYVVQLARHFHGSIAAGTEYTDLQRSARDNGIPFYPLPHLRRGINLYHDFLAVLELLRLFRRLNPDIIHLNSSKAGFLGSVAGRLSGIPVVFTAHGFIFNQQRGWLTTELLATLERYAGKFRNFTIAVSDADRDAAITRRVSRPERIQTIHNGLPAITFVDRTVARQTLNIPQEKFVIGTIANLYHRKGLDILLRAVGAINRTGQRGTYCVIIGEGPQRQVLERLIRELCLESSVRLAGAVPDAATLLRAFDLFVLASRREGFPYALIEANQAGLPVIATSVGGNAEAMGPAGYLISAEDPLALAEALRRFINQPGTGKGSQQKFPPQTRRFAEDEMLNQTAIVYQNLLRR